MPQRKPKNYARNKKAFDEVMQYFRDSQEAGLGAMSYEHVGMGGTPNRAKPTVTDFRCDVWQIIKRRVKSQLLAMFLAAYVRWDSEDAIEREVHAQKCLGDRRHSIEQRMGEEFVTHRIFPIRGNRGYFHVLRQRVRP